MYKTISMLIVLIIMIGCSDESLSGQKPPIATIEIGNEEYRTTLGTYCWKNTCADAVGPFEMLKGKTPIHVRSGETISLNIDYKPKPNKFHLVQIVDENKKEVPLKDNQFTAPQKQGVYYYSYGVWWKDEQKKNGSHGSAFYAFVLKVD
ncbi:hypothetical protein [Pseudalkalibacillus sp. SCS-8]|uniref:hypothetical protein n=1 Tax=Pseudalkalibacillus nanhaiensis TaxID=3115291 RepID=UPI0032DBD038